MKKYSFLLLILLLGFVSCDDEEFETLDPSVEFVQFQGTSFQLAEANESVTATVLLGARSNPNGVAVNFNVASDQMDRFTVEPSNGVLQIPAGQFSADIVVTSIDNLLVDGAADIEITLTGGDLPVGTAENSNEFTTVAINLLDDDCPVDSEGFVGTYLVEQVFTSGPLDGAAFNLGGDNLLVDVSLDPDDPSQTTLIFNNNPGTDFNIFVDGEVVRLNPCPGTVTFLGGNPLIIGNNFIHALDADNATATFDDENFVIVLEGFIDFQTADSLFRLTMTRMP